MNLPYDTFAEATINKYCGKANKINPDYCNGCCSGSLVNHISCKYQYGKNHCESNPLSNKSETVVIFRRPGLHLHAVTGLPLHH